MAQHWKRLFITAFKQSLRTCPKDLRQTFIRFRKNFEQFVTSLKLPGEQGLNIYLEPGLRSLFRIFFGDCEESGSLLLPPFVVKEFVSFALGR